MVRDGPIAARSTATQVLLQPLEDFVCNAALGLGPCVCVCASESVVGRWLVWYLLVLGVVRRGMEGMWLRQWPVVVFCDTPELWHDAAGLLLLLRSARCACTRYAVLVGGRGAWCWCR